MKTYLIGYDLHKPGQEYSPLFEKIKELANGYWHHLDSTWVVNSAKTATEIRDILSPYIDSNDELLVIQVAEKWASRGLTDRANAWLRNNLQPVGT